jgi:hypothetical protein
MLKLRSVALLIALALPLAVGCSSEKTPEPKLKGEADPNLKRAGEGGASKSKPNVAAPVDIR